MKTQSLCLEVYLNHCLEENCLFQCIALSGDPIAPSLRGNALKSHLSSLFLMFSRRLDLSELATMDFVLRPG